MNEYITKVSHQVHSIEKEGRLNKFSHKTTAKDFRGWVTGWIGTHARKGNMDMVFVFQEVLKAYNHFEKVGIGKVKSWKGESGIVECIKEPDRVIIKRFRKDEPDSEPKEVLIEISKQKLNAIITALNLNRNNQPIETSKLAMDYSKILGLGHFDWDRFFADRKEHNLLTTALSFLESEGLIKYSRRGKTTILKDKLDIQLLLNN